MVKSLKHDPKTRRKNKDLDIQLAIKENAEFLQNEKESSKPIPLRCSTFKIIILKFNICRC